MRLLIIKTSAFGDIIQSFDLLVYIKKKNPTITIDWVVESSCQELVSRHPLVDHVYPIAGKNLKKGIIPFFKEIISFKKKIKKYDVVIDLQGNVKSSLYLLLVSAKKKVGFGRKHVPEWPNLFFTNVKVSPPKGLNIRQDYLLLGQTFFQDFFSPLPAPFCYPLHESEQEKLQALGLPENYSILAPFSKWKNKELDRYLIKKFLLENLPKHFPIFLLCKGQEEKIRAEELKVFLELEVTVLEGLSFPLLTHVLRKAKKAICMDSMILHLAAIAGCPTVSFFTASNGEKYAPIGSQHVVYQSLCPYKKTFPKRCSLLRQCEGSCRLALQKKI